MPGTPAVLGTRMQSVGEAMAIGRTFPESLQKALRSLEHGRFGLNCDPGERMWDAWDDGELVRRAAIATPDRPFHLEAALRRGITVERLYEATGVDPWFLDQIALVVAERDRLAALGGPAEATRKDWRRAKRLGFSDAQLAWLWNTSEADVRAARLAAGVRATMKTVDTCGAEFEAHTPYHYSTYEDEDEVAQGTAPKIIILGSGPNRIGQGVEFDYCCVQASFALHDAGFETVMVNCNPETVSTDYDTSDRLYFEPVTFEDVTNVIEVESATGTVAGVIVSLGGQTRLKLAAQLPPELILGTIPGRHRSGRGPGALERLVRPAGDTPTGRRDSGVSIEQALAIVGPHRLPGAGPSELRARRPGHGDRVRRRGPAPGHGGPVRVRFPRARGRPVGRAARPGRPLPGGRHRGGRRRGARPGG